MFRRLAVAAALLALAGGAAATVASSSGADPTPAFEATFDNAGDFAAQFDHGYSGMEGWHLPGGVASWQGDHTNADPCSAPTSSRTITLSGTGPTADVEQPFYWCAPSGPASGHVMTAVDTTGYNIGWFSPKPTFTGITKVCWDLNETELSHRKWIQVLFVSDADAHRYPAGMVTFGQFPPIGYAVGTGGFDLGYVSPEFDDPNGPTTRIISDGSLFGFKSLAGSVEWFNGQDFTNQTFDHSLNGITDKATRFQQCLEQQPDRVRFTRDTPSGAQSFDLIGAQIPQDARRVVFEDDNYDVEKTESFDPAFLTWHWDNIQVFAGGDIVPPATTAAPPTSEPPTTTVATTTTVGSVCPSSFTADEFAWCEQVEQRLTALGG